MTTKTKTKSKKNGDSGFKPLQILDEQLREVLKQVETQGKKLEKDVRGNEWYRKAKQLQKDLEKRAKDVQKDLEKRAKNVQKDFEKRTKSIQKDFEKRTKNIQKDFEKRTKGIQKKRDDAYHAAGLATKAEVDALNRKLRQLNKQVSL